MWDYRGHRGAFIILGLGLSSEAEKKRVLWVLGAYGHCGQSGLSGPSFRFGNFVQGRDEEPGFCDELWAPGGTEGISCFLFWSGTVVRGHDEKTDKISVGMWACGYCER